MFTGSGMPMRFADLDGTMIDVYQAATQMTDESGQTYPFTSTRCSTTRSAPQGYYGVFTANMHTDNAVARRLRRDRRLGAGPRRAGRLGAADARPGSTAATARRSASLAWSGNKLDFTIDVGAGANGLQAMVPTPRPPAP